MRIFIYIFIVLLFSCGRQEESTKNSDTPDINKLKIYYKVDDFSKMIISYDSIYYINEVPALLIDQENDSFNILLKPTICIPINHYFINENDSIILLNNELDKSEKYVIQPQYQNVRIDSLTLTLFTEVDTFSNILIKFGINQLIDTKSNFIIQNNYLVILKNYLEGINLLDLDMMCVRKSSPPYVLTLFYHNKLPLKFSYINEANKQFNCIYKLINCFTEESELR